MTFQVGAITGKIAIDGTPTVRSIREVVKEAHVMGDMIKKDAMQGENAFKSAFAGIKSELGKGSVLGQSMKLLAGGGVVAGLGLAMHQFEDVTGKMAALADEIRSGDKAWDEITSDFLRTLPILGEMTKGFDNLREAMTGEKFEIMRVDALVAEQDHWLKEQGRNAKEAAAAHDAFEISIRRLAEAQALLSMKDGTMRDLKANSFSTTNQILELDQAYEKLSKQDRIRELREETKKLNADVIRAHSELVSAQGNVKTATVNSQGGLGPPVTQIISGGDELKAADENFDAIVRRREAANKTLRELEAQDLAFKKQYTDQRNLIEKIGSIKDAEIWQKRAAAFKESIVDLVAPLKDTFDEFFGAGPRDPKKPKDGLKSGGFGLNREPIFNDEPRRPALLQAGSAEAFAARFDAGGFRGGNENQTAKEHLKVSLKIQELIAQLVIQAKKDNGEIKTENLPVPG